MRRLLGPFLIGVLLACNNTSSNVIDYDQIADVEGLVTQIVTTRMESIAAAEVVTTTACGGKETTEVVARQVERDAVLGIGDPQVARIVDVTLREGPGSLEKTVQPSEATLVYETRSVLDIQVECLTSGQTELTFRNARGSVTCNGGGGFLDHLVSIGQELGVGDALALGVITAVDDNAVFGSSPDVHGRQAQSEDHVTTHAVGARRESDLAAAINGTNRALPCGEDADGLTLCASQNTFPDEDVVVFTHVVRGDIPLETGLNYQYGFVMLDDDDASNDYVPTPQFENDFFRDTDLWYVVTHEPGAGWELAVTDARDGGFLDVDSDARVRIRGNAMVLLIPSSELALERPSYRVTAFEHTGDFGLQGGAWSADIEPPVADPLREW